MIKLDLWRKGFYNIVMPIELLIGLIVFSFVSSITPGPNNIMLLTSGVNFGFLRTIPHMLGVAIGFFILASCVGLGLGALLKLYSDLFFLLKIAAGLYLLYLSWRIAFNDSLYADGVSKKRPMSFLEACLFQWVNPKAWIMAITSMSLYVQAADPIISIFWVASIFTFINLPSVSCWAWFGVGLRQFLSLPSRLRMFNITMAVLLVASIIPIFMSEVT